MAQIGQKPRRMPRSPRPAGPPVIAQGLGTPRAALGASLLAAALTCLVVLFVVPLRAAHDSGAGSPAAAGASAFGALPVELAPVASMRIGASERGFWALPRGRELRTRGGGIETAFTASRARLQLASD